VTGRYAPLFQEGPLSARPDPPSQPNHFWYATDAGIFTGSFDGATWIVLSPPVQAVSRIELKYGSQFEIVDSQGTPILVVREDGLVWTRARPAT
jgi:hypothetical protein